MQLVVTKKDKVVTTSRKVAQLFEKEHKNVLRDIQLITEPKSGLSEEFGRLNFEPSSYKNRQNKKMPEYLITKDGFTILTMGYTGKKAMKFKEMYIGEFNKMSEYIKSVQLEQQTPQWQEKRQLSKIMRKAGTDIIKDFVQYAKSQGSQSPEKYYVNFTNLANKVVGVADRDNATVLQLNNLSLIEHIIANTLKNAMQENKPYKTAFEDCKEALKAFSKIAYLETV